jgi:hypothetical protein
MQAQILRTNTFVSKLYEVRTHSRQMQAQIWKDIDSLLKLKHFFILTLNLLVSRNKYEYLNLHNGDTNPTVSKHECGSCLLTGI